MALAQILDLDEARRRRASKAQSSEVSMPSAEAMPAWCFVWMPMFFWYIG